MSARTGETLRACGAMAKALCLAALYAAGFLIFLIVWRVTARCREERA